MGRRCWPHLCRPKASCTGFDGTFGVTSNRCTNGCAHAHSEQVQFADSFIGQRSFRDVSSMSPVYADPLLSRISNCTTTVEIGEKSLYVIMDLHSVVWFVSSRLHPPDRPPRKQRSGPLKSMVSPFVVIDQTATRWRAAVKDATRVAILNRLGSVTADPPAVTASASNSGFKLAGLMPWLQMN